MAVTLNAPIDFITGTGYPTWGITIINDEIFVGQYSAIAIIKVYDINTKALKRTLNLVDYYAYGIGTDGTNLLLRNSSDQIMTMDKNTGARISTKTNTTFAMSQSASFKVDLENDRIYYCNFSTGLIIKKYSDGTLLKSYTMPVSVTTGVEVVGSKYIFVTCYSNNKIYYAEISNNNITNLTFNLFYASSETVAGVSYYNNRLYITNYNLNKIQSAQLNGINLVGNKYLIKKDSDYFSINSQYYDTATHKYLPLTLSGGTTPNSSDFTTFGFNSTTALTTAITVGSDTFIPKDKFTTGAELYLYDGTVISKVGQWDLVTADTKRSVLKTSNYYIQADTLRQVQPIKTITADTSRKLLKESMITAVDTNRSIAIENNFNIDTLRQAVVRSNYLVVAETIREVIATPTLTADTSRKLLKENIISNYDTSRKLLKEDLVFNFDTLRTVIMPAVIENIQMDTLRLVMKKTPQPNVGVLPNIVNEANYIIQQNLSLGNLPIPKEYAWDFDNNDFILIDGKFVVVQGLDAIKAWIFKALTTPRYRYLGYTWNYGHQLEELIGRPVSSGVVQSEAERFVKEALSVIPYVTSITNFKATQEDSKVTVEFTAITPYGNVTVTI